MVILFLQSTEAIKEKLLKFQHTLAAHDLRIIDQVEHQEERIIKLTVNARTSPLINIVITAAQEFFGEDLRSFILNH